MNYEILSKTPAGSNGYDYIIKFHKDGILFNSSWGNVTGFQQIISGQIIEQFVPSSGLFSNWIFLPEAESIKWI